MEKKGSQDHPFHPHKLTRCDTRKVYSTYQSRWKCDVCNISYDGRSDEEVHRFALHCSKCTFFDMCLKCYKGYLHPFHTHRLQPARPSLCYPHTNGSWRCDACQELSGGVSDEMCYHCSKCQVDICTKCFKGEQLHKLHGKGEHPLIPVDPRIHYRCYEEWICDVCEKTGRHGSIYWPLFHCKECDENICHSCFRGTKHYLHEHDMVPCERSHSRRETSKSYCSNCSCQLLGKTYHSCHRPNCFYCLCTNCFQTVPPHHPSHPEHPLYKTDPKQAYPQSGGAWHCDKCTSNHPKQNPIQLTLRDVMYHCDLCLYDLCETCFKYGFNKTDNEVKHWVPPPSSAHASSQRSYFSSKEQYQRPLVAKSSVNFIPSPPTSLPTPELCRICGLSTARVTPTHNGEPHSIPLYCETCARFVIKERERCHLCNQIPDGMDFLSRVHSRVQFDEVRVQ